METAIVRPTTGTLYGRASSTAGTSTDKDTFLRLLTAQMQYQDPLSPMDNSQMLAQLAQFTALEQMQNLNAMQQQQAAVAYLGKQVTGVDPETQQLWTGVVSRVFIEQGVPYLQVGDRLVRLEDIGLIEQAETAEPPTDDSEVA